MGRSKVSSAPGIFVVVVKLKADRPVMITLSKPAPPKRRAETAAGSGRVKRLRLSDGVNGNGSGEGSRSRGTSERPLRAGSVSRSASPEKESSRGPGTPFDDGRVIELGSSDVEEEMAEPEEDDEPVEELSENGVYTIRPLSWTTLVISGCGRAELARRRRMPDMPSTTAHRLDTCTRRAELRAAKDAQDGHGARSDGREQERERQGGLEEGLWRWGVWSGSREGSERVSSLVPVRRCG